MNRRWVVLALVFAGMVISYIDRGNLPELMQQFDFSDPDRPNSHRTSTIVPQQALFFMNSPMAVDVARRVTSRPEFLASTSDRGEPQLSAPIIYLGRRACAAW